jgi:hypothetical protein
MTPLEEKIRTILAEVSDGKGFTFAAIIEREDASGRWDLVVSSDQISDWIEKKAILEAVTTRFSKELSDKELIDLGIIEVLDPDEKFMREFNQKFSPTEEDRDFFNLTIAGIPVRHAHVFGTQSPLVLA